MPSYPQPRAGEELKVRDRPVEFSHWPMRKGQRRHGLQSRIFASDPWNVIEPSIRQVTNSNNRHLGLAALFQARDFFNASEHADIAASRPLLIYYCFLNTLKAYAVSRGLISSFDNVYHGLQSRPPAVGRTPISAEIEIHRHRPQGANPRANAFDLFLQMLSAGLATNKLAQLDQVFPQVLLGHRLWELGSGQKERFIEIERIRYLHNEANRQCWVKIWIKKSEFKRSYYSNKDMIDLGRLAPRWRIVETLAAEDNLDDPLLAVEMTNPTTYTGRPADILNSLSNSVRNDFWRSITSFKPFRKYYLYLTSPDDWVIPQLTSIYLLVFYLGSITRYRPDQFDAFLEGSYGAFVREFIQNQPRQWLYMMASEFVEQEVTQAAIV